MDITDQEQRDRELVELWLHWARMRAWTRHEASALISGLIPTEKWDYDGLKRKLYSFGRERNKRYFRNYDLLLREERTKGLRFPIKLHDLWKWGEQNKVPFACNFIKALGFLGRLPDEADTLWDKPLEKQTGASKNSHELRENKTSAITAKVTETKELGVRERETFLYLIATMAIQKYGYSPQKKKHRRQQNRE